MPMNAQAFHPATEDPVSNVLKWILLAVAMLTFGLMGWATVITAGEPGRAENGGRRPFMASPLSHLHASMMSSANR